MSYYDYYYQFSQLRSIVQKKGLSCFNFFKKFNNNTSQGSVGILEYAKTLDLPSEQDDIVEKTEARSYILNKSTNNKIFIVYKIGTETPFLSTHEYLISMSLYKAVGKYLPNFVRPLDFIQDVVVDPKLSNPFTTTAVLSQDLILYEYIYSCTTLANLIEKKIKLGYPAINSLLNQLMLAVLIAQKKIGFVHNDLHYDNVLVVKCLKRTFMIYVWEESDNTRYVLVPTYGYYPVIIDYGFSYTHDLCDKNLYIGIHHNNKGYITHRFDEFTDFKTMLVRLNYSNYKFRQDNDESKKKFSNTVQKLVNKLPIERQTGWDKVKDRSISKNLIYTIRPFITHFVKRENIPHAFVEKYEGVIADLICSLIILPLDYKPFDNLAEHMEMFLKEWHKIEKWLGSPDEKIYILKHIISIISDSLWNYSETSSVDTEISKFKQQIFKLVDKVGKHITLNNVNFKNLYKSILNLSDCFEGIMYEQNKKCIARKRKEWSTMEGINSAFDMYSLVEPFISERVDIETGDYFVIFDSVNECTTSFAISDNKKVEEVNAIPEYTDKVKYLLNHANFLEQEEQVIAD